MNERVIIRFLTIIPVSIIFLAIVSNICIAQEWSRKGRIEISFFGQSMSGDTTSATNLDVDLIKLDSTNAFGFGVGQNFGDHLNGNMEMYFGSMDVTGEGLGITVKGDTILLGTNVNLNLNVLKSRFTPLVSGGIGFIRFIGEFEGWPFDEVDLSYNVGAGFRWNIGDHFLIKAIYRTTYTELEDTDKSINFKGVCLNIGYIY